MGGLEQRKLLSRESLINKAILSLKSLSIWGSAEMEAEWDQEITLLMQGEVWDMILELLRFGWDQKLGHNPCQTILAMQSTEAKELISKPADFCISHLCKLRLFFPRKWAPHKA